MYERENAMIMMQFISSIGKLTDISIELQGHNCLSFQCKVKEDTENPQC